MRNFVLTPLILLAACGQGDVNLKNASVADVAKATKASAMLNAGEWANTIEVTAVDMPGLSAKDREMMQAMTAAMVGKQSITKTCISPEQAKAPTADMFAGASKGCRFETFAMNGGTMNAVMKCTDPAKSGTMTMKLAGEYGGNQYAMMSEINIAGGDMDMPGHAGMTIKAKNSGKRIGACPPETKG